jgi:hypothetical protein
MDYLKKPLRARLAERKATGEAAFRTYAPAYGGIWTNEGNPAPDDGTRRMETWELREVGFSDALISLRHRGWYVDHFQSETCRGVVFRLPGSRGFLAGHDWPWDKSVGATVDPSSYDTPEAAARAADRMAETFAEVCREDAAKHEAERLTEEASNELKTLRDSIRGLCRELRGVTLSPAICSAVRDRLKAMLRERRELWGNIREWRRDYWSAVQG